MTGPNTLGEYLRARRELVGSERSLALLGSLAATGAAGDRVPAAQPGNTPG
jgi:hypothetical protein